MCRLDQQFFFHNHASSREGEREVEDLKVSHGSKIAEVIILDKGRNTITNKKEGSMHFFKKNCKK